MKEEENKRLCVICDKKIPDYRRECCVTCGKKCGNAYNGMPSVRRAELKLEKFGKVVDKIQKVLVLPDVHLDENVPKDYKMLKPFIEEFKPDIIVLLGDFMDISSLSAWDRDKKRKMENRRFKAEVDCANKELDFLQKNCGKVVFLEGNHENRVSRYLDFNPEMEGMIDIQEVLRLEERGIEWCDMNDLYKIGHMYFTHGMYTGKYFANKHLMEIGENLVVGHTHKTQTAFQNQAMGKEKMVYGLGTLGDKAPDYMQGRPSNWINQFGIMYVNERSGDFNFYPVNIIDGKFIWEGRQYS